jgi:hypothetical protein
MSSSFVQEAAVFFSSLRDEKKTAAPELLLGEGGPL